jgi:hypothetical protein
MRVTRLSLVFLLAGLFVLPAWAQVTVGVLSEDVSRFQPYVSQATQAGQQVTLESFSESALYQQVYTLGALGLARIDAGEILTKWLPQIQGRLLDLTPYAQELQAAGVELYSYGNVVVGVRLPWRDDAFLGILLRSRKAQEALNFLKLFRAAEAKITPLSLSVGPLVVAKARKSRPEWTAPWNPSFPPSSRRFPPGLSPPFPSLRPKPRMPCARSRKCGESLSPRTAQA